MILSFLSILLLSFCILGYAFFFKVIVLQKKEKIFNIDFVYGLFILVLISIFINFFSPLKYFFIPFILFGIFFFTLLIYKKKNNLNFLTLFIISFLILFISHGNGITYDSQLYHLQTIQLSSNNRLIFGIANLQPHYGMNSSWHAFLSLISYKFNEINLIYLANLCVLSFCVNEIFSKKNSDKAEISHIFLILSILYIFTYSFFHPYNNGTILNLLGSPDVDFTAMILYILSIYFFTLLIEEKKIEDFNLLKIISFLAITTKVSYLGLILFFIYALISFKKEKYYFNKLNFFIIFAGIIWLLKSFILSGCFVFPVSFTCFDVFWALDKLDVESYSKIVQSFARDTPDRLNFTNFDYTLNSNAWLKPWIESYFLKTEFLYVSFLLILLNFIFFLFIYKKNNNYKISKKVYFLYVFLFIANIFLWMRAPEIRFGYGTIISFVCLLMAFNLKFFNFIKLNSKILFMIFIIIFIPLIFKNFHNYKKFSDISFVRNFSYSEMKKIYTINNYEVFMPTVTPFCNDFQEFCTYQGFNVNIQKINGYYFLNK